MDTRGCGRTKARMRGWDIYIKRTAVYLHLATPAWIGIRAPVRVRRRLLYSAPPPFDRFGEVC